MKAVLRSRTTSETAFIKVLVGASDHIFMFTMIGSEACEVIAVVQTVMVASLPFAAILSHPPDDVEEAHANVRARSG